MPTKKVFIALFIIALVFTGSACSKQDGSVTQAVTGGTSDSITITGLQDGSINVSIEKIRKLPKVTQSAVAVDSAGKKTNMEVTGGKLEDLLKDYGKSQKDFNAIRLIAGDGYSIEVPKEVLQARDIILAYEIDGKPLDEKTKPIRAIIPEERAMYWVRNLIEIEIATSVQTNSISKLYFLETASSKLEQSDYTYYEKTDKAIKNNSLISLLGEGDVQTVSFKAADGFEKNETAEIFSKGYIKITGEDTPIFLSPDMPKGMFVKDIVWFKYGGSAVFSYAKGSEILQKSTSDSKTGIALKDIIKETGLSVDFTKLVLAASDGYTVELASADMEKGIVYLNDEGLVCTYFDGLQKNTSIKGLSYIESVK